jgi:small conductance mechanosensitive channel
MLVRQSDSDAALVDALQTEGLDAWSWATAGVVLVVTIVVSRVVKYVLNRVLKRRLDSALAELIARVAAYTILVVGLVYALDSLGVRIGPLLGALGIAGIAIAFALKDLLENFVAGVLLQLQRPFTYGDQVSINEHEGTVRAIDSRLVTIVTPDGETIKIPSATVIRADIDNLTEQGARRTDVPVGVAYGTDLQVAHRALAKAVEGVDEVHDHPSPEVLLVGFGESSIDFVVRYWHAPTIAAFWKARSDVTFAVEEALATEGITIPFPQRTLWLAGDGDDDEG